MPAIATMPFRWPGEALTRLIQNRPNDANLDINAFRRLAPQDVKILEMLIAAVTRGKG